MREEFLEWSVSKRVGDILKRKAAYERVTHETLGKFAGCPGNTMSRKLAGDVKFKIREAFMAAKFLDEEEVLSLLESDITQEEYEEQEKLVALGLVRRSINNLPQKDRRELMFGLALILAGKFTTARHRKLHEEIRAISRLGFNNGLELVS